MNRAKAFHTLWLYFVYFVLFIFAFSIVWLITLAIVILPFPDWPGVKRETVLRIIRAPWQALLPRSKALDPE